MGYILSIRLIIVYYIRDEIQYCRYIFNLEVQVFILRYIIFQPSYFSSLQTIFINLS